VARKNGGHPFADFVAGRRDRGALDGIFLESTRIARAFTEMDQRGVEVTFGRILPFWFFVSCETNWPGSWFKNARWFFAIDETFHIMALGMLIGTLVIVDLRLLGFGMRRQSVVQLSRFLGPWTLLGVASMIITGIPLFMSEAIKLSKSTPFFYKMVFLLCAVTLHFTLHRKVTASSASQDSGLGKLAASLSLLCWLGVALAGRAIAFL
jgi:hypothetical protein